ncbi:ABC transporter ATP-binding protein [Tabrizicola sp. YIM 78059]|uniref:ABC transporter ATP-binding protein n=1 Tax=Tabrizicola sp. YIM 78059 TaxID=2529861 RepID=UPI0010AAF725|nr:ABC transporter ATP-binding protein [Tabrizicola sp. YIM 78059]
MIVFDSVSKSYHTNGVRKTILHDFSFAFPRDRNIAIMGRNGVGKSTLMRLLAGTEPPDSGHVYRSTRVSWPLGFTGGFNGSMTGIENIRFVSRIYGQDPRRVIEYVTEFAQLGPYLRLPIRKYSSGMKARLAFGLSMAIDFDIYLIDEITSVGDEEFKQKSKAVFENRLARSQIIMISHSQSAIQQYCDCGLLLEGDRIRFFDRTEDLLIAYKALN